MDNCLQHCSISPGLRNHSLVGEAAVNRLSLADIKHRNSWLCVFWDRKICNKQPHTGSRLLRAKQRGCAGTKANAHIGLKVTMEYWRLHVKSISVLWWRVLLKGHKTDQYWMESTVKGTIEWMNSDDFGDALTFPYRVNPYSKAVDS